MVFWIFRKKDKNEEILKELQRLNSNFEQLNNQLSKILEQFNIIAKKNDIEIIKNLIENLKINENFELIKNAINSLSENLKTKQIAKEIVKTVYSENIKNRILDMLKVRALSFSDLEKTLKISSKTLSKYLKHLINERKIKVQKSGKKKIYYLA